jgi:hypothetical protein
MNTGDISSEGSQTDFAQNQDIYDTDIDTSTNSDVLRKPSKKWNHETSRNYVLIDRIEFVRMFKELYYSAATTPNIQNLENFIKETFDKLSKK